MMPCGLFPSHLATSTGLGTEDMPTLSRLPLQYHGGLCNRYVHMATGVAVAFFVIVPERNMNWRHMKLSRRKVPTLTLSHCLHVIPQLLLIVVVVEQAAAARCCCCSASSCCSLLLLLLSKQLRRWLP